MNSYKIFQDEEKKSILKGDIEEPNSYNPSSEGTWLGLKIEIREKAKTGKSNCKSCNTMIKKGSCRYKVTDHSLFKMCIAPGDHHEGVSRGYVENVPPDGRTVSKKTFFVHENCLNEANDKLEGKFREDWAIIQPHLNSQNSN